MLRGLMRLSKTSKVYLKNKLHIVYTLLFVVLISMGNSGCSSNRDDTDSYRVEAAFDYDELIHYSNPDFSEDKLMVNTKISPIDSLRRDIILGEKPTSITDPTFPADLSEIGFKKKTVNPNQFSKINDLFRKVVTNITGGTEILDAVAEYACIYVYRDILVFKREGKTVGIAKICFGCHDNIMRGENSNTGSFGYRDADYEKLDKILNP